MLVYFLSTQHAFKQIKEVHQLESNSVLTPRSKIVHAKRSNVHDEIAKLTRGNFAFFPGTENSKYGNTNDAVTPNANYVELKIRSVYMMRLKKIDTKG